MFFDSNYLYNHSENIYREYILWPTSNKDKITKKRKAAPLLVKNIRYDTNKKEKKENGKISFKVG